MRKSLTGFVVLMLVAGPALAQSDPPGSLPPPVKPQPLVTDQMREPGLGERLGIAADRAAADIAVGAGRAARATAGAIKRAGRWTGDRLERAGEWTRDRAERMRE